jgi:hypothetical protein
MLRIEPRLAFINGVLLANRVLIFCFQLLAVYVLLVHNCGECRIVGAILVVHKYSLFYNMQKPVKKNTCQMSLIIRSKQTEFSIFIDFWDQWGRRDGGSLPLR